MTLHALIGPDDAVVRIEANIDPTTGTKPGYRWLPVEDTNPSHDAALHIKTGPVVTVEATRLTRVWTVRDKTAQELTDETNARLDDAAAAMDRIEDVTRAAVLVIMDELNLHSTRLAEIITAGSNAASLAGFRTAMQAIQPIPQRTAAQLKTAIRGKLGA
jgi:hypothetical protein